MALANLDLLEALKAAGAPMETARRAAESVVVGSELATQSGLAKLGAQVKEMVTKAEFAKLEARVGEIAREMVTRVEFTKLEARVEEIAREMVTRTEFANLKARVEEIAREMVTRTEFANLKAQVGELKVQLTLISRLLFLVLGLILSQILGQLFLP